MDNSFFLIAALMVAGMVIFTIVMWPRWPAPNRRTSEQVLTEAPIKRPPD